MTPLKDVSSSICKKCNKKSKKGSHFWICCDKCDRWYHSSCVGLAKSDETLYSGDKLWKCKLCLNHEEKQYSCHDINSFTEGASNQMTLPLSMNHDQLQIKTCNVFSRNEIEKAVSLLSKSNSFDDTNILVDTNSIKKANIDKNIITNITTSAYIDFSENISTTDIQVQSETLNILKYQWIALTQSHQA